MTNQTRIEHHIKITANINMGNSCSDLDVILWDNMSASDKCYVTHVFLEKYGKQIRNGDIFETELTFGWTHSICEQRRYVDTRSVFLNMLEGYRCIDRLYWKIERIEKNGLLFNKSLYRFIPHIERTGGSRWFGVTSQIPSGQRQSQSQCQERTNTNTGQGQERTRTNTHTNTRTNTSQGQERTNSSQGQEQIIATSQNTNAICCTLPNQIALFQTTFAFG